jgi:signal transduction histidine kinase
VFDKHYRAQSAGTTAGTGLGLYSSRLIVEAHGGRLWAESTVGTGSTFLVALPISGS